MIYFALLMTLLSCADANFIESPAAAAGAPTDLFSFTSHTQSKESPIHEGIHTLKASSDLVTAFGKAYQSFVTTPGGFVPAFLSSLETLRTTPEMGHAVNGYLHSIKKVPRAIRRAARKVKKLHIPLVSNMAKYLLQQIDHSLDHTREIMAKELIIHYMDHCRNVGNASVFRLAQELYKYRNLHTGVEMRKRKTEECYDKLRQRVTRALKKGWIRPLEHPACTNGWGSFNLYKRGNNLRFMNANRYLPCESDDAPATGNEE